MGRWVGVVDFFNLKVLNGWVKGYSWIGIKLVVNSWYGFG